MRNSTKFDTFLFPLLCLSLFSACREAAPEMGNGLPKVLDRQLKLELVDEAPGIMTPIGLTIGAQDQLYLLESHTHTPPKDYQGPAFDRIKKGIDADQDGIPESWQIFADSISDGMNLTAGPDQTIYLACKDMIVAFRDNDEDGQSDQVDTLLSMWAGGDIYDHAGIMGVTLSPDGWLFVSRGNTGGLAWKMTAADGSTVSHYGDGGNVVRLTAKGEQLEEIASGFWNPFDIRFIANGHLMLTDNDPDSRGPNRLVDLVYGGDYGYKSLYGGSGIHPFLAWNGELPGTLPYAAPLGEAPCGFIDGGFTNFGPAYKDHVLAAIWEENSIVSIPLSPEGTLAGKTEIVVKGDSTFHPVAFATNSKGELFFTDWVVRQYPNHQKGRLWKLSGSSDQPAVQMDRETASGKGGRWLHRSLKAEDPAGLQAALESEDPFTRSVARKFLSRPEYAEQLSDWLNGDNESLQLQALLTLFHNDEHLEPGILKNLLRSDNEAIQRTALKYVALKSRADLYDAVRQLLPKGHVSPELFGTYLATIRHLQPNFIEQYQNKARRLAKQIERKLPEGFLLDLLQDQSLSPQIRAAVLPQLDLREVDNATLLSLLEKGAPAIQMALLRLSTRNPLPGSEVLILQIATDNTADNELRSLALLSLAYRANEHCEEVANLLTDATPEMVPIALRYLCRCSDEKSIQEKVSAFLDGKNQIKAMWQACNGFPTDATRPEDDDAWRTAVNGGGNAEQGKWVFYSPKAQCQNCHMIDNWGSDFGPDLSHIGSSKSKTQLLTAILEPSAEISPEWQGWFVTDAEGITHYGRQIDVGFDDAELLLASGEFVTYDKPRSYGMATSSLMPDGLEGQLTVSEVNDLVTYLMSLK